MLKLPTTPARAALALVACLVIILALAWPPKEAIAGEALIVAVASNFLMPAQALAKHHAETTGQVVQLTSGSTGALVAQAANGAPFDVLLAADLDRPQLLIDRGHTSSREVAVYARGRLVFWQPASETPTTRESATRALRVAIANPRTAPYGAAAINVLNALGSAPETLRAENVGQAFAMVATGNVEAGFVAASQVLEQPNESIWRVPNDLHRPIEQGAVILARARSHVRAEAFIEFMLGDEGQTIIEAFGYDRAAPRTASAPRSEQGSGLKQRWNAATELRN